ncbi:MAG: 23S rRNA (uracil(1939)-C(5))-methyltransferase RlmD [Endomicrobia bacterium]|nr:23S rRNA (uracil(1939)-C(5))-methyltransferase RlmD [Endomicrobiia bacterium]
MNILCNHFGKCGGCQTQNLDYNIQLLEKENFVREIFKEFNVEDFQKIIPSPDIWYYRNKMEFVFGKEKNGEIIAGLREKNKFYKVVDLKECKISVYEVSEILEIAKKWAKENNLQPYDFFTHKGKLRYIVVKHSKTFNEIMLNVIVTGTKYQIQNNEKEIFEDIVKRYNSLSSVSSIYLSINNNVSDNAIPQEIFHLYGKKYIKENINGIEYLISPTIFLQTNPRCCKDLYRLILDEIIEGNTLDLYCGSGGITLQIAKYKPVGKIIGIDASKENIEVAFENLKINSISLDIVEFINENVENFLLKLWKSKFLSNLSNVILDPPRPGLSKKVKSIINEINANKIIYVSCNPKTLYEDLKSFIKFYKIKKIIPIDMFPHTPHIEIICVLEHR